MHNSVENDRKKFLTTRGYVYEKQLKTSSKKFTKTSPHLHSILINTSFTFHTSYKTYILPHK